MRALFLLAGICGIPAMAVAQPADRLPVPGKSAIALAHRLIERSGPRFEFSEDQAQRSLLRSLVGSIRAYKPASCDPSIAACKATADKLATEGAREYVVLRTTALEEGYGALFESQMSAEDITAAYAFVGSTPGAKFASALTSSEMPPLPVISYVSQRTREFEEALYDRFLRETASLPRRILRVPPPPVLPSKQKRP